MNHIGMTIGIAVLMTGACELADIGTDVKYVGPFQTARPFDCRMQMTFGPLSSPHQDIARARTQCPDHLADEEMCFDDMRRKACLVGADTIYGIAEDREGGVGYLMATFARSLPGPIVAVAPVAPSKLACDPICSPGFACQRGTCVPQCNPACASEEICTRQRLCAPAGGSASRMLKKPQTEGGRQIATVISWDQARTGPEARRAVDADGARQASTQAATPGGQVVFRIDPEGAISKVRSDVRPDRSDVDSARTAPEAHTVDGSTPAPRASVLRAAQVPAAQPAPGDGND